MGVFAAELLAELQKSDPEVYWIIEIDLASGVTLRLSPDGTTSKSMGHYRPWVKRFGNLYRALPSFRGGLTAATFSYDLDDVGGQVTRTYGRSFRRLATRLKLVSPNIATSSYFTAFNGVIDRATKNSDIISVAARQNDDAMVLDLTRAAIRPNVFPNLPGDTDLRGKGIPYVLGAHDSTGLAAHGMLPCHLVGQSGASAFDYLVSLEWRVTVIRVFSAGTELSTPADWLPIQTITSDGRKVTLVRFSADQGTNEVLADVQDSQSDVGPAACFQRTLTNLAYNDYHADTPALATAPIYTTGIAQLDLLLSTTLGLGRAYHIPAERRKVSDVVKEFGDSYDAYPFWRYDGTLNAIGWEIRRQNDQVYLGPGSPDGTLSQKMVLSDDQFLSKPSFNEDPESEVTTILGKSGRRAHDGAWMNQRSVVLRTGGQLERSRTLEMPWIPPTVESTENLQRIFATNESGVSNFTPTNAATVWQAVTQHINDLTVYANSATSATIGGGTGSFDLAPMTDIPDVVSIQSVVLWLFATGFDAVTGDEDELKAGVIVSGTPYFGTSPVIGVSGWQLFPVATFLGNPGNSYLPWTKTDINALTMRVVWTPGNGTGTVLTTKRARINAAYIDVNCTIAANVSPAALAILSRQANRYRTAPRVMTVRVPLKYMDYDLGDDVSVSDPREGWGTKPWQRRLHRYVGVRVTPDKVSELEVEVEDVQDQQTTFWLVGTALAGVDGASAAGDGVALVTHGSTVTVTRDSVKTLDSPAGVGFQTCGPLVQVRANCWPSDRYGTLVERTRTAQARGMFVSSGTGLTPSAGSGTITFDATVGEQLFTDTTITAQHLLITAGSPHSTETTETWPTSATLTSAGSFVVSGGYRGSPAWRVIRDSDGFFWNDATGAFQSGSVTNQLAAATTWTKFTSKVIPVGTSKTRTFKRVIVVPAGATSGSQHRIGYYQLEEGEWASSPIVTDATTITRAADVISFTNDKSDGATLYRMHPDNRGRLLFKVQPNWSSASVTAGTQFWLWRVSYDANNRWELYYTAGTGWRFTARSGGSDYTATVNVAATAGTRYLVDARWTSSLGEWDRSLTLTLVVRSEAGAVLGSAHAAYVRPVLVNGAVVNFCEQNSTADRQFDGYILEARLSPYAPSDAEMGL